MNRFLIAIGIWLALATGASAQVSVQVVTTCGAQSLTAGTKNIQYMDITGNLCSSATGGGGTFTVTGFNPTTTGTPITATTGGVTGALPAGAEVVATNSGTTNAAFCKLGASATTSDQQIAPNGGWFGFTVGGATQLTCITGSGTTTINLVGGSGLPTGTGGGGSTSTNLSVGATAAAVPGYATYNGGINGGNLIGETVDSSGNQLVNPATAASWGILGQASTTSGQVGHLTQGAVTTSAPSYTTAQTSPLSLDTAGGLRENLASCASTVCNANGQATMANSSPVVIASNQSAVPISAASGAIASGALASGSVASGAIASGAVASGAFASGAVASGAFASGSISNGADVALGSTTDAAGGTGTQTAISILKQLHLDVTGSVPAGTNVIGYTSNDPCAQAAKTNLAISTTSTSLSQIIAASGSNKIYICSISLVASAATAFNLNTGTGSNCASSTAALIGSTTAANGMSLAANGGFTLGNGSGTVAVTAASSALCTLQSNSVTLAGNLTYVQQ